MIGPLMHLRRDRQSGVRRGRDRSASLRHKQDYQRPVISESLDVRMANGPGRVFDGQATTSRMAGGVASSRMASVMGQGLKPLTIR